MPLTPLFPTTALFRSDSPGGDRFVLTLDGVVCGLVTSAQGGTISAPLLREPRGNFIHKRLGAPMPEPIQLSFDLFLHKLVYDWINDSWQGRALAKSGSLIALDANLQAKTELQFENAVISGTDHSSRGCLSADCMRASCSIESDGHESAQCWPRPGAGAEAEESLARIELPP
jgi:hypothetical protein